MKIRKFRHASVEAPAPRTLLVLVPAALLASLATGDLIAHFDDDDYYAPRYLERMAGWIGDAGLVRLAGWFIYSQPQSRLWYWDQRVVTEPTHFRLLREILDAKPVSRLSEEDQKHWIDGNLKGWGFCFVYRRDIATEVGFESVEHGEDGKFLRGLCELGHEVVQAVDEEGLVIKLKHPNDTSNLFPQYALPDFLLDHLFEPGIREFFELP